MISELEEIADITKALVGMDDITVLPSPHFISLYCGENCQYKNGNQCRLFGGYIPPEKYNKRYQYYSQRRERCIDVFHGVTEKKRKELEKIICERGEQ